MQENKHYSQGVAYDWRSTPIARASFIWHLNNSELREARLPQVIANLRFSTEDYFTLMRALTADIKRAQNCHLLWFLAFWLWGAWFTLVLVEPVMSYSVGPILGNPGLGLMLSVALLVVSSVRLAAKKASADALQLKNYLIFSNSISVSRRKLEGYLAEATESKNSIAMGFCQHLLTRSIPMTCFEQALLFHCLVPSAVTRRP